MASALDDGVHECLAGCKSGAGLSEEDMPLLAPLSPSMALSAGLARSERLLLCLRRLSYGVELGAAERMVGD